MNQQYVDEIIKSRHRRDYHCAWFKYLKDSHYNLRYGVIPILKQALKDFNQSQESTAERQRAYDILNVFGEFGCFLVYGDFIHRFSEERQSKPIEVQETHYPYIPLDYGMFFRLLGCLEKVGKFIDVGCGIGDKVLTANLVFGAEAEGIEYTPQTYYIGKHYLDKLGKYPATHWDSKPPKIELILGDAFDHDFKKYDTIYLYHPICDYELMHKLYLHIFKTMKNGAVMIEAMNGQGLQDAVEIHNDCKRKKSRTWHVRHFQKIRGKIKPLKEVQKC